MSAMTTQGGDIATCTSDGPVHSRHACHCLHAHGAADVVPFGDIEPAHVPASAPVVRMTCIPASTRLEPQLRPPIHG